MAVQPTASRPGMGPQARPSTMNPALAAQLMKPQAPIWMVLLLVTTTMIALGAMGLAILNRPEPVVTTSADTAKALNIPPEQAALIEEGKEMQVKIAELERNLAQSRIDIQKLGEDLQGLFSQVEGLNSNLAFVQSQTAKTVVPVNIQPPQPEVDPNEDKK